MKIRRLVLSLSTCNARSVFVSVMCRQVAFPDPGISLPGEQSEKLSETLGLDDALRIFSLIPITVSINGKSNVHRCGFADTLPGCTASPAIFFYIAVRSEE